MFLFFVDKMHFSLSTRRLGCMKTSTTWAACTCLKSAQRWKIFGLWSECVKSRPHWGSRGEANGYICIDSAVNTHAFWFTFSFFRNCRILFLRQQSKELDKLKNQNSYMVWGPDPRGTGLDGPIETIREGGIDTDSELLQFIPPARATVRSQ